MADFNMTVTVSGLKLLTDALAGKMVTLTGIHLGSGSYTGNLSAATQLVQEQIALPLDKIIKGDNQITAKSVLQFRTVETGFIWTEVGLFAKESDGPEILYAYGYAGNKGDYIPGADEATLNEKVIRLTMLSSNEANIVAEVDGSTVYASQEDLDDLRESVELSITNITNVIQQVTGVDPDDPDAEPPSGSMVVTLTHTKSDTVHAFTGLGERTGLVPCQFKSTAGYTEGDTAIIDGTAYTITLTGADAPETDLFVSGKSILIDVDTEGKLINFKSGGGLTNGKLALADATEDTVFNGRTFYARDKTMRTGRALATPTTVDASKMFTGVTAYNQQGQMITGAPPATTAVESDVKSGKTYYDNNGVLRMGTRSESPVLLRTESITLNSSSGGYYTYFSTPFSWVYVSFVHNTSGWFMGSLPKTHTTVDLGEFGAMQIETGGTGDKRVWYDSTSNRLGFYVYSHYSDTFTMRFYGYK